LKQIIEKVKKNISEYILSKADFDRYRTQALSTEQKPPIEKITFNIKDLEILKEKAEEKLHRQAASNKIEKLLKNPKISSWVETGKSLHKGKTDCEFCGNKLPIDLLPKLNEHFSENYELLKKAIAALLEELNTSKINLNLLLAETAFYKDIQSDFKQAKPILEKEIRNFNDAVSSLINDLETKQKKPFDKLEVTQFVNNAKELEKALAGFNAVISKNNDRTVNFEREKNAAVEKLKEHFAAEFEKNEKYSERQTQLENEQTNIKKDIEMQKQEIDKIKAQLDESVKGAEKVNEYLKIFFEKDDIKIIATDDKKFKMVRGTEAAKNLSEGEKTAISFAYFVAKLGEQNNTIADTIIYIDDPVSSLDSNHLFNIYSFIKDIFYERKDLQSNKYTCKCRQLFISTHNIEFYNLVCDWSEKQSYLIKRIKNSHNDESILTKSDDLIKEYKSEYVYLFSLINEFYNKSEDTFEHLYYLPNILRRFVETYLSFKYLSGSITNSIHYLIPDSVKCERAKKFMHYYSHSLTTNNLIGFPDLAECAAVVNIIIDAVQQNDRTHYNSLVEAVKKFTIKNTTREKK
jgi:wobble nucleotide-excising tRNase